MKNVILLLVLVASLMTGCTYDSSTEDNATELIQYEETYATGKEGGSSPGDKDGEDGDE